MDASTPTGRLIFALKQQLKARHLSYQHVASRLKVSESTVKRYFSGKAVTIDVLQRLAEIVDLDLLSLVIVAQDQSEVQHGLSKAQQAAFSRRGPLSATYFLLNGGWTPAQIAREFDFGRQIDTLLANLEALGMIRRMSKRGVKILVKPDLGKGAYGQMTEHAADMAHQFLREINLRDDKCEWMFCAARLSQGSVLELRQTIKHFENDVRELSKRDMALLPEETQWYRLFVGAKPISRNGLWGPI